MTRTRDDNSRAIREAREAHRNVDDSAREADDQAKEPMPALEVLLLDVIGNEQVAHCRFASEVNSALGSVTIHFAATTASGLVLGAATAQRHEGEKSRSSAEMLPWPMLESWGFDTYAYSEGAHADGRPEAPLRATLHLTFRSRSNRVRIGRPVSTHGELDYTYGELVEILEVARTGFRVGR